MGSFRQRSPRPSPQKNQADGRYPSTPSRTSSRESTLKYTLTRRTSCRPGGLLIPTRPTSSHLFLNSGRGSWASSFSYFFSLKSPTPTSTRPSEHPELAHRVPRNRWPALGAKMKMYKYMDISLPDLKLIKDALEMKIASLSLLEEGGQLLSRYERLLEDIDVLILQH